MMRASSFLDRGTSTNETTHYWYDYLPSRRKRAALLRRMSISVVKSDIRLDQIDWGGVRINGIPPLRAPKVVLLPSTTA
jgi:hypothetical protein